MTIKIGTFYFSVGSGFAYGVALAFAIAFAVTHAEWNIVGVLVSAVGASLLQSKTTQDAPATSLSVKADGDSIPVINGKNEPIAKVVTLPPNAVDHISTLNDATTTNGGNR